MILKPRPVEVICFLCQQSVEKALKSIKVGRGDAIPRTHDLVALTQSMLDLSSLLKDLLPACVRLSNYAVTTRYPYAGELPPGVEERAIGDAQKALEVVRVIVAT